MRIGSEVLDLRLIIFLTQTNITKELVLAVLQRRNIVPFMLDFDL